MRCVHPSYIRCTKCENLSLKLSHFVFEGNFQMYYYLYFHRTDFFFHSKGQMKLVEMRG